MNRSNKHGCRPGDPLRGMVSAGPLVTDRRRLLAGLGSVLLATGLRAEPSQPRVVFFMALATRESDAASTAFRDGMRELGHV